MKKIPFFLFILISFFIINNLIRSIVTLWQKQDLVVKAKEELEEKKRENQVLAQKLTQIDSAEFVETQAREKLLLAKQAETEVVLPRQTPVASPSSNAHKDVRANWQKWLDLFF